MGGSNGNSNSNSSFVLKTYEMVDEPSTNSVVSWSASGISFVVLNPVEFSRDVLPTYFKHNNFSSFIRQLNTYGFRKVDPHQWEFANEEFVRGKRHLLKHIHRRKPTRSHANAVSLTDEERQDFLNTIENLEQEKRRLQSELERHKQENRECENRLNSLGQTLQNINQRQEKLMGSLDRLLEEPRQASSSPLVEHQNKKRRLLEEEEVNHGVSNLSPSPSSSPLLPNSLNLDLVERLDSYLTFWDKFIEEIPESYRDLNDKYDDCRCSSPEVAAAATCDSPRIPSISVDPETGDKSSSSGVDVNDFFWQQFLTEAPDSSVGQSDDSTKDHSGLTNYQQNKHWGIHVEHNHTQQMMEKS